MYIPSFTFTFTSSSSPIHGNPNQTPNPQSQPFFTTNPIHTTKPSSDSDPSANPGSPSSPIHPSPTSTSPIPPPITSYSPHTTLPPANVTSSPPFAPAVPSLTSSHPPPAPLPNKETTEIEHLNGLVLFTSGNGFIEHNFAYVINPSTRKMLKLRGPGSEPRCLKYGEGYVCYFFGFDEEKNEHKILTVRMFDRAYDQLSLRPFEPSVVEVMLFSVSDMSWRKIDFDVCSCVIRHWDVGTKHSVCVNSVIYLILQNRGQILSFDLRTERFSLMSLPGDAVEYASRKSYCKKGLNSVVSNYPFLMKINGCLGLMCCNPEAGVNEMDVWILKDYSRRVWVRETVGFLRSRFMLDGPFALNPFLKKDNVVSERKINVAMYDVESRSMKSVEFALGYEFLQSTTVRFDHVRSYTESILPLPRN